MNAEYNKTIQNTLFVMVLSQQLFWLRWREEKEKWRTYKEKTGEKEEKLHKEEKEAGDHRNTVMTTDDGAQNDEQEERERGQQRPTNEQIVALLDLPWLHCITVIVVGREREIPRERVIPREREI